MKICKYILGAAAALCLTTGCVDKDPEMHFFPNPDVDFTYAVDGEDYQYDFYVVSRIKFNNTSTASGNFTWDFGDGTTSNEVSPTHKYEKAGVYKVKLTHDTKGTREYPLMIYDITPVLSVNSISTEVIEFNNTLVDFALELPNPEHLKVRYDWTFPEGTTDEVGQPLTSFTGFSDAEGNIEYPGKVKFSNIGSQRIDIRTYFDVDGENRRLEDAYLNVQVGVTEPAPTLYYAQRNGNIKAYKLLENIPVGTKVLPYDLGVPAGKNVFNLIYDTTTATNEEGQTEETDWIYILDAGKQYYYINDADGVLGDGQMTAMRADGTGVNTVVTNIGGAAFLDPFYGLAYNGNIYYSDRNTGVTVIPSNTRGAVEGKKSSTERASYFFQNNVIPYYGNPWAFGGLTSGIYRDKTGLWWISKKNNGAGLFRFTENDIYPSETEAKKHPRPYDTLFNTFRISSFTLDEQRQKLYVWNSNTPEGLTVYTIPSTDAGSGIGAAEASIEMNSDAVNTTAEEGIYVTQMAVEQNTGRVFFCFRPASNDTSGVGAGVNYFDPADGKIHKYGEDKDLSNGIVINPRKTKLF